MMMMMMMISLSPIRVVQKIRMILKFDVEPDFIQVLISFDINMASTNL